MNARSPDLEHVLRSSQYSKPISPKKVKEEVQQQDMSKAALNKNKGKAPKIVIPSL